MNAIDEIIIHDLMDWDVLYIGIQKKYIQTADVAKYASNIISNEIVDNINIIELADANHLDYNDVKQKIKYIIGDKIIDIPKINDIWLFAELKSLYKSELSEEEKIRKLQMIYANFDYPEILVGCSIYTQTDVDPIEAMKAAINVLRVKLLVSDR